MKRLLLCFICLYFSIPANAHTLSEESFVCPIDGKRFKQMVDASGTSFGSRLDLKPLGPTAAPWAIPQCSKCGFVLYEDSFDKETLEKLKPFVQSDKYRKAFKEMPSYYCLALIREFLNTGDISIAEAYLQASWQAESDSNKCKACLDHALPRFQSGLKTLPKNGEQFANISLLCGEIERRLGQFDSASARFQELKKDSAFKKAPLQAIIDRQLDFIKKKDSAPHAASETQEDLLKEY